MFRYLEGAGRSQGASAGLAYLVSVTTWGKSQPSCLMLGLSWKMESLGPGSLGWHGTCSSCKTHHGIASSVSVSVADGGLGPARHSLWLPRPDRYLESCGSLSRNMLSAPVWTYRSILRLCSNSRVIVVSLFFRKCHKPVSLLVRRNTWCQVLTVLQYAVFYLG